MVESYLGTPFESTDPAQGCFEITPHDSDNFAVAVRSIYVGGTGNVALVDPRGVVSVFASVPSGSIIPARAIRVNSTSTTATNLVGLI